MNGPEASTGASVLVAVFLFTALLDFWLSRRRGPPGLWDAGLPLRDELPPLQGEPHAREGRRGGLVWWPAQDASALRFVADRKARVFPRGLRGIVYLAPAQGRVRLTVAWMPPMLPWMAAFGIVYVAAQEGYAAVGSALGTCWVALVLLGYWASATRAAAALRQALIVEEDKRSG